VEKWNWRRGIGDWGSQPAVRGLLSSIIDPTGREVNWGAPCGFPAFFFWGKIDETVPRSKLMKEATMSEVLQPDRLREALKQVIDPEIFENIVDLGLVYDIETTPENGVVVRMTLTTPHCPMGPEIIENVQKVIKAEGAASVEVNIVWEPMWTPEMMTPALKAQLGIGEEEPKLEIELPPPPPPAKKKKGLLSRIFGG
jgi:metal-sulfur cluster biosynthetic enzyme